MTVLRENGNEQFQGSEPTEKFIKIIDDGIQAMTSHDSNNALYFEDSCQQKQVMKISQFILISTIKILHLPH